jgi:hypothetical protein
MFFPWNLEFRVLEHPQSRPPKRPPSSANICFTPATYETSGGQESQWENISSWWSYLSKAPTVYSTISRAVEARGNPKIAFRFFRPTRCWSAYNLELPSSSQVHLLVHVSQLKRHVPSHTPVSTSIALIAVNTDVLIEPVQILKHA